METKSQSPKKLLLQYTIPSVIGMLLNSFIVLVDGCFIGRNVGSIGLAAVNVTLPVFYLFLGITLLILSGGGTLALQSFGANDMTSANKRFTLTLILCSAITMCLVLIIQPQISFILGLLGAKTAILPDAVEYLGLMLWFYPLMMLNITLAAFIRGEGRPQVSLLFILCANILNVALDYWFIQLLQWGMRGAALASGISISIAFVMTLVYHGSGHSHFKLRTPDWNVADIKSIFTNGSSEFIGQMSIAFTTYLFNGVALSRMGVSGVAALSIVGYVSLIQSLILAGMAQGVHPLVCRFHGAGSTKDISAVMRFSYRIAFFVGLVFLMISLAMNEAISGFFSAGHDEVLRYASLGLKLFAAAFLFNGFNTLASTYFTALGDARTSAVISSLRSLVLVTLFLMILPRVIGDYGIWLAVPLAEILTLLVSIRAVQRKNPLVKPSYQ